VTDVDRYVSALDDAFADSTHALHGPSR